MSNKNEQPFLTPELLDVTVVETCKIKEVAETDRKRIAEHEETIRVKNTNRKNILTDSGFLWAMGLPLALAVLGGAIFSLVYLYVKYPEQPKKEICVESIQIVRATEKFVCSSGGKMEVKSINPNDNEIRCHCIQ